MANQKISELSAITVIDDTDVLPIVDGSALQTKKITIAQIKSEAPVQSVNGSTGAVTVQPTLVSGTNIKTINSQSLLGSGDITISGGTTDWGDIGGTLANQTDLQSALDGKQATLVNQTNIKSINGTSLLGSGDLTIGGSVSWGGITGTLSNQTDLQSALDGKEATITAGTTSQYYRGDKSFQTLDKTAVGLGNVDNTSDANKPISTATQTALDGKVDENTAITGATKTKITYDSKGLVTAGADLVASDLPSGIDATKLADGSVTNTELQYIGTVTSNVQTQLDAKTPKLIDLNTQTGTTYTLVLSDADKLVEMNNAAANTLTVPPNSSVAFSTGTQIIVLQKGAGTTTIAAGSGVTLLSKDSALGIGGQYGAATCIKIATDTWYVIGDLA